MNSEFIQPPTRPAAFGWAEDFCDIAFSPGEV
jgi:hypothetical protein